MRLRSLLLTSALAASPTISWAQGLWCYPQARMVVFSNYDGGRLTINVDEDIPDLHIGVLSYEFARVYITGAYAANVTAVHYAGFNGANDHCDLGGSLTTSIVGVPASAASIVLYPSAATADPNGWPSMICAYSCAEGTDQGGCNTAAQAVGYLQALWGLAPRFHRTQYGCWGEEWAISQGGNCCSGALSTEVDEYGSASSLDARLNGDELLVRDPQGLRLLDASGRLLLYMGTAAHGGTTSVDLSRYAPGPYILVNQRGMSRRFVITR